MFDYSSFPNISTGRLNLRCLAKKDTDDIFAVRSDYEVTKYNSGAAYTETNQALNLIERSISGFQSKSSIYWAISLVGSDTVVGQAGFNCWDQDSHSAEVGFDLRRDHWRQGIMTEALAAILSFGFSEMGLNRIGAQVSTYNDSCKALLLKLNFQHEGTQRDQYFEDSKYHDLDLFAVLKREAPATVTNSSCTITYVPLNLDEAINTSLC